MLEEGDVGPRGEAAIAPHEPNVYQKVQAEQVALLLAHRNGSAECDLIERMVRNHELVRRQVSARLETVQLTFGDQP